MTTTKVPFSKFIVSLEDPANPGQFKAPCGFMSRSLKIDTDVVETTTPDCDDEDAALWTERAPQTRSIEISGEGTFAAEDIARWRSFALADASWNCQVKIDMPGAQGGGVWEGKFLLTSFETSGERKNHLMFNMTLQSDGAVTWTDAA